MKNVLTLLYCMFAISAYAQIVVFSDDLLSQYNAERQEKILNKPIEFDSLYCPVDFVKSRIVKDFSHKFTYLGSNEYPNYIGYHIYLPECDNDEVLSFNSSYDTVALRVMPQGIYEVSGMIITKEESDEIRQLVMDSATIIKDSILKHKEYWKAPETITKEMLLKYSKWDLLSAREINRMVHNGYSFPQSALLVMKGDDGYSYYLKIDHICIGAILVEQYNYIKEYLLKNEWILVRDKWLRGIFDEKVSITTNEGLVFHFIDTTNAKIAELAIKDGKYIAIMRVGEDSILYHCSIDWEKTNYFKSTYYDSHTFLSDTLDYLSINCDYGSTLLVRKQDYMQMKRIDADFQNYVDAYRNKHEAELEARKVALDKERIAKMEKMRNEMALMRQQEKISLVAKYGETFGLLIFEHKVTLGMNKEMCLKSWGAPRNKVIRRSASGTQEIWAYGIAQYLVFQNGLLVESTSIS